MKEGLFPLVTPYITEKATTVSDYKDSVLGQLMICPNYDTLFNNNIRSFLEVYYIVTWVFQTHLRMHETGSSMLLLI